jgi:hypothetical protein
MVPEPMTFDKGLVFVKDTDILLSGDKWTIAVNIALDDYAILIDYMKIVLGNVKQKIQVYRNPKLYSFDIHWEEIMHLDGIVRKFEMDIMGFQKLLFEDVTIRNPRESGVRSKRGLIYVLGYRFKYLFGTADAKDVKQLTKVCDELHVFKTKMVHAAE